MTYEEDDTEVLVLKRVEVIRMYEVRFHLENGSYLNVLTSASTADEAKRWAHDTLMAASEPRGDRDSLRYCWRYDEITVSEGTFTEGL